MTFLENYADRLVYLLCAAMIFIPLERILPRIREQKIVRANLTLDVLYMLLGALATMLLSVFFIAIVVSLLGPWIPGSASEFVASQPVWLQVILLIVVGDFYYYWAHRTFHAVPLLWKFHAVHHSIQDLDWVAAHRTHPVDTALTNSGVLILAILLDFSVLAVLIFSFQFFWHSLLKHSNVAVGWGPLRWVYLTPTFHHWHHANVKEAYDKNFAGQLPLWDVLFGTAIMREDEGPARYGVDDPVPVTFLGSLAYPFRPRRSDDDNPADPGKPGLEELARD
ncbi:sterol desaturase family protein [Erythrobacter sp. JK5]|uniref:sterol desaturase family protein n=1 Tax=Erythrobacter sp. JK5 TaxID=2829500 RepID=UPI001BA61BAC|nr:sterol desaturase family protein [Erythrobacter sp. JK5]QUL36733.1 sterol desaturase family protein [Erythrobacter sp. JK5]